MIKPDALDSIHVFLSLPMRDRSDEEIRKKIDAYTEAIYSMFKNHYSKVYIRHNYCPKAKVPNGVEYPTAYFLGMGIAMMSGCDYVAFTSDFTSAKGCYIEEMVAVRAHMKRLYFTEDENGVPHVDKMQFSDLFLEEFYYGNND